MTNRSRLPEINLEKLFKGDLPKTTTVSKNRNKAIEYALYCHYKKLKSIEDTAKELDTHYNTVLRWLKHYNIFIYRDPDNTYINDPKLMPKIDTENLLKGRKPKLVCFNKRSDKLGAVKYAIYNYVKGKDSLTKIAKDIGVDRTAITYWLKHYDLYNAKRRVNIEDAIRAGRKTEAKIYKRRRLPSINLKRLLRQPKCPPLKFVTEKSRMGAIKYTLYRYAVDRASIAQISREVDEKTSRLTSWFLKYRVYRPDLRKVGKHKKILLTDKIKTKLIKLWNGGHYNYKFLAEALGFSTRNIADWVRYLDLVNPDVVKVIRWKTVDYNIENDLNNYLEYKRAIYYCTKIIAKQYFTKEQLKLIKKGGGYHLDHRLSLYEGFHRGKKPVPWQYLCHPANLQIITMEDNVAKSHHSCVTPKDLISEIKEFNLEQGEVKLPCKIDLRYPISFHKSKESV